MKNKTITKLIAAVICMFFITSCAGMGQNQKTGTGVGVVGGAIAGGTIGAVTGGGPIRILTGAVIGGVVGGLVGTTVGKYMDNQEQSLRVATERSVVEKKVYIERTNETTIVAVFNSDVLFDFDSSVIKPGGLREIDNVAKSLRDYPNTSITIEGHTDSVGTEQYNLELSQRRAEAVSNALIQRGVDPQRITTVGLGEGYPVSSDDSLNRRVNMIITGK